MKMPEKDPRWIGTMVDFYSTHSTVLNGFFLTFIVAFHRVVWGGGKLREGIGEGVVCGLVGVNIGPVISPMLIRAIDAIPWLNGALTEVAAGKVEIFISCLVGLIGLQAIRELVFKIVNKKAVTPDAKQ
ncbi:putative phage holin [Yersinia enterocolitica]|uniref:phage holin family protein n=1 Tax=Yersinia enterocolitica TaxID=630 RepID=UPI0005E2A8B8|nr:phage holin family protein [Yersinia enterocolitica]EKN5101060.1 holin [Yersinia enterocolitica]ELI8014951.1 phage holin family protein [Yersinia enterocolitica]ELI8163393.1 phage holin family protein [Yersinia enterocolitica]CQH08389.1 putative phage holin [Yersinia enterocolitica]HDL8754112.1 phage holin family protein [Yersinia enterocolitica]